MTWDEYQLQCAKRLAECHNRSEFDAELRDIDEVLKRQPPTWGVHDFWGEVLKRYRQHPKLVLKEATAAAALNALLTAADTILSQRAGKK